MTLRDKCVTSHTLSDVCVGVEKEKTLPDAKHDDGSATPAATVTLAGDPLTGSKPPPTPVNDTARAYSPAAVTTTPLPGAVI